MLQPFQLYYVDQCVYYVNHIVLMLTSIFKHNLRNEKERGLYQNKVNLSLTFFQRLGY